MYRSVALLVLLTAGCDDQLHTCVPVGCPSVASPPRGSGRTQRVDGPSGLVLYLSIDRTPQYGSIGIEVDVDSGSPALFADGDVYSVSLVGSDQTQLVDRSWSVRYRSTGAQDPECPPTCRLAAGMTEL